MSKRKVLISSIAILGFLGCSIFLISFFAQNAEAGATQITIINHYYKCVRPDFTCVKRLTWTTTHAKEGWWHRNFGRHPHKVKRDEIELFRKEEVFSCTQCEITTS